jgi:hypothetical protein
MTCNAPFACSDFSLGCRRLPDGRFLHLIPMIFNVRLVIESPEANRLGTYDDGWCFDRAKTREAIIALATWDGAGDPPGPWKKHIGSGRRGPGAQAAAEGEAA